MQLEQDTSISVDESSRVKKALAQLRTLGFLYPTEKCLQISKLKFRPMPQTWGITIDHRRNSHHISEVMKTKEQIWTCQERKQILEQNSLGWKLEIM